MEHSSMDAREPSRPIEPSRPHDHDAERAALGCCIGEGGHGCFARLGEQLCAEDFDLIAHARIFEALRAMATRRESLDLVVLAHELATRGDLEIAQDALAHLLDAAIPASLDAYARIVREHSLRRRGIEAARGLALALRDLTCPPSDAYDAHRQRLAAITARLTAFTAPRGRDTDAA